GEGGGEPAPSPSRSGFADNLGFRLPSPASLATLVTSELLGLPEQLLGNVLLADTLAEARQLHLAHPAYRVVTRGGELLEPDGTLTIGPPKADAGLVSPPR